MTKQQRCPDCGAELHRYTSSLHCPACNKDIPFPSKNETVQRWDCYYPNHLGDEYGAFCRNREDGEWVKFEDYQALTTRLTQAEAENDRLQTELSILQGVHTVALDELSKDSAVQLSDGAHEDWLAGAIGMVDACAEKSTDETGAQPGQEPWRVSLPVITPKMFNEHGGPIQLIEVAEGGQIQWTSDAVDFACFLQTLRKSAVETSAHPDPAKRCQHDLLKPACTIIVGSPFSAQCAVCLENYRLPEPEKAPTNECPNCGPNGPLGNL